MDSFEIVLKSSRDLFAFSLFHSALSPCRELVKVLRTMAWPWWTRASPTLSTCSPQPLPLFPPRFSGSRATKRPRAATAEKLQSTTNRRPSERPRHELTPPPPPPPPPRPPRPRNRAGGLLEPRPRPRHPRYGRVAAGRSTASSASPSSRWPHQSAQGEPLPLSHVFPSPLSL